MAAIDQVKEHIVALGLTTRVAGVIESAIGSAGYQLVPQPGAAATVVAGPAILRRRVPGSGALGSVQIAAVEIGSAGWMVFREHRSGRAIVRTPMKFLPARAGAGSQSLAGFTEGGGTVRGIAVDLGLSGDEADAGVAAIAAAGYALEPTGGGTIASPIDDAGVERRLVAGSGGALQLVAASIGTAGWAIWPERVTSGGELELGDLAIVRRPAGYAGSAFDAAPEDGSGGSVTRTFSAYVHPDSVASGTHVHADGTEFASMPGHDVDRFSGITWARFTLEPAGSSYVRLADAVDMTKNFDLYALLATTASHDASVSLQFAVRSGDQSASFEINESGVILCKTQDQFGGKFTHTTDVSLAADTVYALAISKRGDTVRFRVNGVEKHAYDAPFDGYRGLPSIEVVNSSGASDKGWRFHTLRCVVSLPAGA